MTGRIWLLLVACSSAPPAPAQPAIYDENLHCAVREEDRQSCEARGDSCVLAPPMWCQGTAPTDGEELQRRNAPCACICDADRAACGERR